MDSQALDLAPLQVYLRARQTFLDQIACAGSCRDPLGEFSEWIVSKLLNARHAPSRVQKGWDLLDKAGRRIQVKYLANPTPTWINEHHVVFTDDIDDYAIVVFESFSLSTIVVFQKETIARVCERLGKRHPRQECTLQFTRRNLISIIQDRSGFERLGIAVYLPPKPSTAEE